MNLKNNVSWDLAKFHTFLLVITVVSLGGDPHRKNREYGGCAFVYRQQFQRLKQNTHFPEKAHGSCPSQSCGFGMSLIL